jgi:hypothetical protein
VGDPFSRAFQVNSDNKSCRYAKLLSGGVLNLRINSWYYRDKLSRVRATVLIGQGSFFLWDQELAEGRRTAPILL